ncbi:hypothetical protein BHE75_00368 [Sphingomonas haloaromaticamans]|uniref:Uncharacterized protein n=1 Tax=Edaphosphingomonas haloaromaticamans TaxID=653954 RepID=A0A1S1H8I2_9SPHN|nr:hypothetical protein BHE75_00368 [Sphingomonas haloaromaticamans]
MAAGRFQAPAGVPGIERLAFAPGPVIITPIEPSRGNIIPHRFRGRSGLALFLLPLMGTACIPRPVAPPPKPPSVARASQPEPDPVEAVARKTGDIVSQPAQDVGIMEKKIPPVLIAAAQYPYAMEGVGSCDQIGHALAELDAVLGPDLEGTVAKENKAAKLAEAGGKMIVNGILPFRGLVREVSGAAPAQRRLNAAIDAGYARRGFLRGLEAARNCRLRQRTADTPSASQKRS